MEKLKRLWYTLVAPALLDQIERLEDSRSSIIASFRGQIAELNSKIYDLEKPRPLDADVNGLLRAGLNHKLEQDGLFKHRDEVKTLRGQVDILRQQLRQSLAYIEYLQDMVRPHCEFNFNELPLEKRQGYFKRIDDQLST